MFKQMLNMHNLKKYPISILAPKGSGAVSIEQPLNNAKSGLLVMETWKDVPKYKDCYQASTYGRIKSLSKHKKNGKFSHQTNEIILKQSINKYGYNGVCLYKNSKGKFIKVHRLIAIAFLPNPENKPQVNHKDGIKTNNRIENLEWVTNKENFAHAKEIGLLHGCEHLKGEKNPKAKLKEYEVIFIRRNFDGTTKMRKHFAEIYNLNICTVNRVLCGKYWRNLLFDKNGQFELPLN